MNSKYDAMISYTVEEGDKEFANDVYEYLTARGLDIWFSGIHLSTGTGKPIAQTIADAILNSKYAICIISKKYLEPRWSSVELSTVLEMMIHEEIKVIPILCNITGEEVRQRNPLLSAYMWMPDNPRDEMLDKVYSVIKSDSVKGFPTEDREEKIYMKQKSDGREDFYQQNPMNERKGQPRNINMNWGQQSSTRIEQQIVNKGSISQQINIYMNGGTINF